MTTPKPPPVNETCDTGVWAHGTAGEERHGAVLDATEGIIALHDRRIPKTKANIDHLVGRRPDVEAVGFVEREGSHQPTDRRALHISRYTVDTHVAHLMQRLGVSSRAAVAAEAVRQSAHFPN